MWLLPYRLMLRLKSTFFLCWFSMFSFYSLIYVTKILYSISFQCFITSHCNFDWKGSHLHNLHTLSNTLCKLLIEKYFSTNRCFQCLLFSSYKQPFWFILTKTMNELIHGAFIFCFAFDTTSSLPCKIQIKTKTLKKRFSYLSTTNTTIYRIIVFTIASNWKSSRTHIFHEVF